MTNNTSLINLGDLSKPATVLIEKISDAIGGIFRPYQMKRIAKAETEAAKIRALADIEIKEIQQRALVRFVKEETKKQINIEEIVKKTISQLKDNARPQDIENDWITNFFEKCRLISDEEMQQLWSKVLAGEANNPGIYSKRTVNFISTLDKSDARLFTTFCSFIWVIGDLVPLIYDPDNEIYTKNGVHFNALKHLDDIGLIRFDPLAGFRRIKQPEEIQVFYYGQPVKLKFKNKENNSLGLGEALLSKVGQELVPITGSKPIPEFFDFIIEKWSKMDLTITHPAT